MTLDYIKPVNMFVPNYMTITSFEQNFDILHWRRVMRENWFLSVYAAATYLVLVFGGAFLMRTRKPFKLNRLLAVWNIFLSVMSIWSLYRIAPEFIHLLTTENGLHYSICEWRFHNQATALWGFLFVLSKFLEFGDTAFVVLRKKPLKFIHYYHHVVTAVTMCYVYQFYEPANIWCTVMNLFVHSLMYPYYAIRAMQVKMPKIVPMTITTLQITQMFAGLAVTMYSVGLMYIVGTPADCPDRHGIAVAITLATYGIFAVMFFNFFITNYCGKQKVESKKV